MLPAHPPVEPGPLPPLPHEPRPDTGAARCLHCAYTIEGLPSPGQCPECGALFDLDEPETFTRRPPFMRWTYWAPGLLTAFGMGTALFIILAFAMQNWGWAMFIAAPIAAGVVMGYTVRSRFWAIPILVVVLGASLILTLATLNLAGMFCGMALGAIFLGPIAFGAFVGAVLRYRLKQSSFSQRGYLPILLAGAFPLIWGLIEGPARPGAPETIVTTRVIDAPPETCWEGIVFYEEVEHTPPLILRIGLAHPLFTVGSSKRAGDVKTCVYNKGWITKRVTEASAPNRLAFEVISQRIGYERDVRLTGGAFEFRALGGGRTEVRLSTTYEPLLAPRFPWRPFERYAVHTLHGHVIEGIRLNTLEPRGDPVAARGGP